MNVVKRIGKLAGILAVAAAMVFGLVSAFGAEGDVPAHNKTLKDNGDGTYQLALDVTGDAEKKPSKANVIVVFDTSSSMNTATGNTEVTYTPTTSTGGWNYQDNLYGLIDGEYRPLTRTTTGNWPNITYHFWYNGQEYTGQRYSRQEANQSRLQAAEDAVNELAAALLDYNGKDGNPEDTIEMALVDFANTAEIAQEPTTNYSEFEAVVNSRDAGNNNRGTNWEAGLRETLNVDFNDEDPTYVIFVSDGNPTFYLQDPQNTQRGGSGQETNDNVATSYAQAQPAAKAIVDEGYEFYTVGIYGNVDRMQGLTTSAGAPASNYYSAENTAALQDALAEILAKIEMAGIGNVEIDDGTTNQVVTSSGTFELLEVDETSYRYWRAGGDYGTGNDGLGTEWTDSDTPAPPAAELVDGTVEWDLSGLGGTGILENGVKYTVTFDVYPSQTSYDIIAQLKNGDLTYGDTTKYPQEVWNNIVNNGGGSYSIRTNTTATLNYDDTRTEELEKPVGYTNPDPVATDAETLTINKTWEGGDPDVESLKMTVLMDNKKFHESTLSTSNSWKDSSFISIGIIKGDNVLQGAEGHDFTFAELDNTQYHWELDAPTVHPMLIDGNLKMLVKVDDKHPASGTTYTINGATYYVDEATTGLTAVNHRRSNLNLKKIVTGEDAPENATFPFTLTVNNSKANDPASTDTNSDNFVWFSIYDTEAGATVTDATVSGVAGGPNADGYYWAKSGAKISVAMKDGWNLRFINLPSGTTYSFEEGTTEDFAFDKAENTGAEDSSFEVTGTTAVGTVEKPDALAYEVTFTNKYEKTNLEITKVWEDANDQDGVRPSADEFAQYLTLSPAVEGAEPTVVDNEDGTYTITYTGLPRFNNGKEIEYTVTEAAIENYTPEGSPAKDHGTITNTHVPEKVQVDVEKEWVGPAGEEVTVELYAGDAETGKTVKLNANNEWKNSFKNLPKYKDGVEIKYTVVEAGVTGVDADKYDTEVTGPKGEGTADDPYVFTITNTNKEKVNVTAKKVWDDANDQDGVRPTELALTLNSDPAGVEAPEPTISGQGSNEWTYTWTGLPKYDNSTGTEYKYTVTEETVPTDYTCETKTVNAGGTITNTHVPEVISIEITKVWKDKNNVDNLRIPAEKFADYLKLDPAVEDAEVKVTDNGDNTYTITFSNLPKNSATTHKPVEYKVTESQIPGYTTDSDTVEDGGTITNIHVVPENASIIGLKVLENYKGDLPTDVFKFTISGISFEAAEEESADQSSDEATTDEATTEESTADNTADVTSEEADKAAEEADKSAEEADKAAEEAKEAKEDAEEAQKIADELESQGADGAEEAQKAAEEAKVEAEETQKAAEEAKVEAEEADKAAEEAKAEAENTESTVEEAESEESVEEVSAQAEEDDVEIPLPAETTVYNKADGTVAFGEMEFKTPGTYTYEITESGSMKHVTNDPETTKVVTIVVTKDGDDGLKVEVSPETPSFTFTNVYNPPVEPVSIDPPVEKVVKGDAPKKAETYTFKLDAANDAAKSKMPKAAGGDSSMTMTITGAGEKEFGVIKYTEPGTYDYIVTEVAGSNSNCEYDGTVYGVRAIVTEGEDGNLNLEEQYFKDGTQVSIAKFQFVNTYTEEEEEEGEGTPTGDNNNFFGAILLLILSGLGLGGTLFFRRREEN